MSAEDREKWDGKYGDKSVPSSLDADEWLQSCVEGTAPGHALDCACGLGHNAIWLARQGWTVDAIDVSSVGLKLAAEFAAASCASVNWINADLDTFEAERESYDLAVVTRFLDRERLPSLIDEALRPGGLLIYETFSYRQLERSDSHIKNPAFVFQHNELPTLFPNFESIKYEEVDLEDRSVARFFAKKR